MGKGSLGEPGQRRPRSMDSGCRGEPDHAGGRAASEEQMNNGAKMDLSVVIPVYNERGGLPWVIQGLKSVLKAGSYEIIVVDDGSKDGGIEEVIKDKKVTVIRHPYNKGYGAALKTGIRQAKGTWVLIIDGDGS